MKNMNILKDIVERKKIEVACKKSVAPTHELEKTLLFQRKPFSLKSFLLDFSRTGIIAEFKRKSPSKGDINAGADVAEITKGYTKYGASALSVLTDQDFFGGGSEDLIKARINDLPILRKDFIIDEYQVIESKSIGADTILLIAACLTPEEVKRLARFAKQLHLEVILEIHAEEELGHICSETEIIGINNRDLKTFEVNIERSLKMAEKIPADRIKIAESGISSVENIMLFKESGFSGFLIGENFMKEKNPSIAFASFVKHLKEFR
jgi:indole-3-glycerol phosphate synthase